MSCCSCVKCIEGENLSDVDDLFVIVDVFVSLKDRFIKLDKEWFLDIED